MKHSTYYETLKIHLHLINSKHFRSNIKQHILKKEYDSLSWKLIRNFCTLQGLHLVKMEDEYLWEFT